MINLFRPVKFPPPLPQSPVPQSPLPQLYQLQIFILNMLYTPVLDQIYDGYQVTQTINQHNLNYSPTRPHTSQPIMPPKDRVQYESHDPNRNPTNYPKKCVDTLYVSSSMFRHLDPHKLSTEKQDAQVLF